MMKRLGCLMIGLFLLGSAALADENPAEYIADFLNQRWVCETFKAEMTSDAQEAFSGRLMAEDQIVCGAQMTVYGKDNAQTALGKAILMALRRKEKMLLMAATLRDGLWTVAIESDSFLPVDGEFNLTAVENCDDSGHVLNVSLAIVRENETWNVIVQEDAAISLNEYVRVLDDGSVFSIDLNAPSGEWNVECAMLRAELQEEEVFVCAFPERIGAWTMDCFPGTVEALRAWAQAHQPDLREGQGFISGVNLRERATSESESLGVYTAKVQVLGSEPGKEPPWYQVQIGDTQGFVSGRYLLTDNGPRVCELMQEMLPVACVRREVMLYRRPEEGEDAVLTLPAGTMMHVILEKDGRLHVVIPRGEISWNTDWDGTYGFIPADAAVIGTTAADVRYP